MKVTTKRYVVTTDAVNCYGYRVLTNGIDRSQFDNNPILIWMHIRAFGNSKDQILPLGVAVDLKFENGQATCRLGFDESDDFAMQVYNKYQAGILNMLSLDAKPIEVSEEPALMLAGQTGPTVTKCILLAIACVDIGANHESCAVQLFDNDNQRIDLNGLVQLSRPLQQTQTDNTDSMKLIQLTGEYYNKIMLALKLDDAATESDVAKKVADLVQLNADQGTQIIQLSSAKTEAENKLATANNELVALKQVDSDAKVIKLADDHKEKYLPAQREHFIKLAKQDFDGTKALLESMPKAQSIATTVGQKKGQNGVDYAQLSYDQMDKAGLLVKLKAENIELYKDKFQQCFGKEYKD